QSRHRRVSRQCGCDLPDAVYRCRVSSDGSRCFTGGLGDRCNRLVYPHPQPAESGQRRQEISSGQGIPGNRPGNCPVVLLLSQTEGREIAPLFLLPIILAVAAAYVPACVLLHYAQQFFVLLPQSEILIRDVDCGQYSNRGRVKPLVASPEL